MVREEDGGTPPSVISADQRQPCAGHERRARPCSTGIKIGGLPFDFGSQLRKLRADYRRWHPCSSPLTEDSPRVRVAPSRRHEGRSIAKCMGDAVERCVTERVHLKGCVRSGNGTFCGMSPWSVSRGSGRDKLRNLDGRDYLLIGFHKSRWFQVPASTDTRRPVR